jgi:hypothetical protein
MITMNLDEFTKEKLWTILVEAIHASVMYPSNKAYVRDFILPSKPDVTAQELSGRLNMSLGEAIVVLDELVEERKK